MYKFYLRSKGRSSDGSSPEAGTARHRVLLNSVSTLPELVDRDEGIAEGGNAVNIPDDDSFPCAEVISSERG